MRYYLIPSVILWLLFLQSGIHATIAGVIIAMTIPAVPRFRKSYFLHKTHSLSQHIRYHDRPGVEIPANESQIEQLEAMCRVTRHSLSPSHRLEYALHPTVTFFIMPLFALANAGVRIDFTALGQLFTPLSMGIVAGLVVGKPLGIFCLCRLGIRLRLCEISQPVTWGQFFAVSCVGGVGFTMSIFINNLAFTDPALVSSGKLAVLTASILAGTIGYAAIRLASRSRGAPFATKV
jgi:NhaA family Na+:H+ antiporter